MPRASRRADVRAIAARLMRERGYDSATMDLIADAVKLNKGTLYHYYPSKSAILYELLSEQVDATLALIEQVPADGGAVERLREFVRLQAEHASGTSDELVVFFQEIPWIEKNLPPEQAADLRRRIETYRDFTEGLLAEGIKAGGLRQIDVKAVHYSIVGILAYMPNWFPQTSRRNQAQLVDEITDFVMQGVVGGSGEQTRT